MLEIQSLQTRYANFELGPLDLAVDDEVLTVLGPSGSGKTTLLSAVAGIVEPDAGSITLDGRSLTGTPLEDRRTGLVFQDGALFPHMTAGENVAYAARNRELRDRVVNLLDIGDTLDRRPATLSGGERQRVALARTLAADPEALLLDEPLSSLDAPIRRRLRDDLRDLFRRLEIPVVYVTHDQRAATALGDRVAVLRDGTLEQVDAPSTVLAAPATRFVAEFTGCENLLDAQVRERDGDRALLAIGDYAFHTETAAPVGATVTAAIRPAIVTVRPGDDGETGHGAMGGRDVATAGTTVDFRGTLQRWLNEGDSYRLRVALESADADLVARVPPTDVDRLPLETGTPVRATVSAEALHVIEEHRIAGEGR